MSTPSKKKDVKGAPKGAPASAEVSPIKVSDNAPKIEKVKMVEETPGVISIEKHKTEKSDNEKKADQLFGVYPGTKEFHFTADGTAFFTPNDASNHAVSLENKEIETIKKQN
jgi:hypothetical protein